MGWASAGAIFDPVAKALVDLNAPDEVKIRVLGDLIGALQDGDWDTEDESLETFKDDPAIVEAFRLHDVTIRCDDEHELSRGDATWCTGERGHDGVHADDDGREWS